MLTVTMAQIFEISLSESQVYKKWQTLMIIGEIQTLIWRNGSKSGVSWIIQES